jgi:anaerobic selenocysteine-containing dehydrogenase
MSSDQINRRDFLKLGAIIGAAAAVTALPAPAFSAPATRSLAECLEMTPVAMADASGPVSASWRSIRMAAAEVRNP